MKRMCRVHVICPHGKMEFVVTQVIRPVHISEPGKFQQMGSVSITQEYQLETSVVGLLFSGNSKAKSLLVKRYRLFQI